MLKTVVRVVVSLAVLILAAGCSQAPQVEMQNADQAFQAASAARADKFASSDWTMAQDTLAAAKAEKARQDGRLVLLRSYAKSRDLYEKAAALASLAKNRAESEAARLQNDAERVLSAAQIELDSVDARLAAASATKDVEPLKPDLAAARQLVNDARGDITRKDFDWALTKARTIRDRCGSITSRLAEIPIKRSVVAVALQPAVPAGAINWLSYDAGAAKAKKENKPIVIDFTASWCGWCKKMERETFSDQQVIRFFKEIAVPVKVWGDDTSSAAMVSFKGERMTQRTFTQTLGVRGFPTFLVLDPQGGFLVDPASGKYTGLSSGYMPVERFLPMMEYYGQSHYKTMSYENYLKKRAG